MKTCPTGAIHFGTKKEMLELAEQRVAKLKARGYEHAGVYNPEGVGGNARYVRAASRRSAGAVSRSAERS